MADNPAPSSVASRFVSESTLEAAQAQRKKDWEAAYARIGEEPPKQEESNEPYDGRSLWEKLQENKVGESAQRLRVRWGAGQVVGGRGRVEQVHTEL